MFITMGSIKFYDSNHMKDQTVAKYERPLKCFFLKSKFCDFSSLSKAKVNVFLRQTKNNRAMKTSQLFTQDNNGSISTLHTFRFDSCKGIAAKRTPTLRPTLVNPTLKVNTLILASQTLKKEKRFYLILTNCMIFCLLVLEHSDAISFVRIQNIQQSWLRVVSIMNNP